MTVVHPFDEAVRLEPLAPHRHRGATSPDYANMVGPFGGLIAATILQAPCIAAERQGDPTALTVNYCGPIADGAFEIESRVVRTNRSNQHWTIELHQGDDIAISASAVFATRRETWGHAEARRPDVPSPSTIERAATTQRPPWTRRYDMRFVKGLLPSIGEGTAGADPVTWVWIADDPPRPLDFLSLTAICDAYFPRIFLRRPTWTPVGTVSLTIYFHADRAMLAAQGARPVLGIAWANHFGNGIFDEHVEVWSDDGRLLASAHQVVYYKA